MKLVDIVIGERYEEKYSDHPVTALDIRENPAHGKREVWVRNFRGEERFATAVRIERLWKFVEEERAAVERSKALMARLREVGLDGYVQDGKYGYGAPGNIYLHNITADEAEAILERLKA